MNLRDFRYLVALADTRHFGQAAERCHVSQPTLSAQLKKLENYLGVELVERQPRRIALTDMGEKVVERARRLLAEADGIQALTRNEGDPLSGKLKVGLIPTIGPYLLPLVARKLHRQLPKLKLMLYEYQTAVLLDRLHKGEVDVGILALPVEMAGLDSLKLYEEDFLLAVPSDHALAKKPRVKPEDLPGETLLLLEDGHCLRDQALAVCSRVDVKESLDYRATSLETLRQMVAAGLGVTLLPALAASGPFASNRSLTLKPFANPVPTRTVGAVWRKSSTRTAAIKAVGAIIQSTMADKT
jgi:LysR family hydrogen peroxide-inducible transcriptional activator